ncbi:signal peptide peptidase 1-like isoform X2 [Typha angustifolia]|uniref:signal peptide peptidase 1-like isoform X2 n=1 Tax=Typha angustifolia TaxID=59011 RepID=UPI003C309B12
MKTHERAANLALAGLTFAPLILKVDSNLNVIMTAFLTVYVGSYRSVKPTPPSETMSNEHAMRFPLVGSTVLLSLFLLFKFVSKDLVNAVLTCYFIVLGIIALFATLLPSIKRFLPKDWNENMIVWLAPFIQCILFHCMQLLQWNSRSHRLLLPSQEHFFVYGN